MCQRRPGNSGYSALQRKLWMWSTERRGATYGSMCRYVMANLFSVMGLQRSQPLACAELPCGTVGSARASTSTGSIHRDARKGQASRRQIIPIDVEGPQPNHISFGVPGRDRYLHIVSACVRVGPSNAVSGRSAIGRVGDPDRGGGFSVPRSPSLGACRLLRWWMPSWMRTDALLLATPLDLRALPRLDSSTQLPRVSFFPTSTPRSSWVRESGAMATRCRRGLDRSNRVFSGSEGAPAAAHRNTPPLRPRMHNAPMINRRCRAWSPGDALG